MYLHERNSHPNYSSVSKAYRLLIALLSSLTPEEWQAPTIAKLWTVKDIASHLLDGNLRTLSFSRDGYFGEQRPLVLTVIWWPISTN